MDSAAKSMQISVFILCAGVRVSHLRPDEYRYIEYCGILVTFNNSQGALPQPSNLCTGTLNAATGNTGSYNRLLMLAVHIRVPGIRIGNMIYTITSSHRPPASASSHVMTLHSSLGRPSNILDTGNQLSFHMHPLKTSYLVPRATHTSRRGSNAGTLRSSPATAGT
jgi:hypothetical protein